METVTNVVNSASAAIWGKSSTPTTTTAQNETAGEEPISGQKGAGTADEPFDKGNEDIAAPTTGATPADEPNAAPTSTTGEKNRST